MDRYDRERAELLAQMEAELGLPDCSPSPLEAPRRFQLRDVGRLSVLVPA